MKCEKYFDTKVSSETKSSQQMMIIFSQYLKTHACTQKYFQNKERMSLLLKNTNKFRQLILSGLGLTRDLYQHQFNF